MGTWGVRIEQGNVKGFIRLSFIVSLQATKISLRRQKQHEQQLRTFVDITNETFTVKRVQKTINKMISSIRNLNEIRIELLLRRT